MRKFFVGLILVLLAASVLSVSADYDLSSLSYTDLQNLVAQAQREMMTRSEFQTVTVPAGLYTIGVEIPAGKWHIEKGASYNFVTIGSELNSNKNEIAYSRDKYYVSLDKDMPSIDMTLVSGMYIWIENGPVIFSTPTGVSFSFK